MAGTTVGNLAGSCRWPPAIHVSLFASYLPFPPRHHQTTHCGNTWVRRLLGKLYSTFGILSHYGIPPRPFVKPTTTHLTSVGAEPARRFSLAVGDPRPAAL
ncbi:hypothetical protein CGRA01v4_13595 [Colletotrichum graminicola]|nr:hypothetical protein CGRA01v4_13595 [Colletotrichum graminicola]